jgi:hypothetical protein
VAIQKWVATPFLILCKLFWFLIGWWLLFVVHGEVKNGHVFNVVCTVAFTWGSGDFCHRACGHLLGGSPKATGLGSHGESVSQAAKGSFLGV